MFVYYRIIAINNGKIIGDGMRKKDDEKQNSIKKAVVQLILEEGFHGTSVSKIAKAAGVSPATVYIYYENKEEMLRDIYQEYAEEGFDFLLQQLMPKMTGEQLIDVLIRAYYRYIIENEEIFHFVDQFSTCPSLQGGCHALQGPVLLNGILSDYKAQGIFHNYYNDNLWSILFYPVKAIANRSCGSKADETERLEEMILIIQKALLK